MGDDTRRGSNIPGFHVTWPRTQTLDYLPDPDAYYFALKDLPWAVWLDSGRPGTAVGRYDILAADPVTTLVCPADAADTAPGCARLEPLQRLRGMLGDVLPSFCDGLPFCGGVIGYLGYNFGRRWHRLGTPPGRPLVPDVAAGLYDWAVVVDHQDRTAQLVAAGRYAQTRERWVDLVDRLRGLSGRATLADAGHGRLLSDGFSHPAYCRAFAKIQRYIRDGDCYQVNLTRRFDARHDGDPLQLYLRMRRDNPAPYSAYMDLPFGQVMSASPERFLQLCQGRVQTRPIKGTRARGATPAEDRQRIDELAASEKDRAENLMIVDLLRNDIGQVCVPGSVQVPELFKVESFATVHHLVSTVTGRLAAGRDAVDLLQACFPGGSITGAPKLRAMQVIDELETASRDVYCGTIFRLGYNGDLDSNISIRTMLKQGDNLYYWSGGGIVADSDCDAEYRESLDKAAAFLALLGS